MKAFSPAKGTQLATAWRHAKSSSIAGSGHSTRLMLDFFGQVLDDALVFAFQGCEDRAQAPNAREQQISWTALPSRETPKNPGPDSVEALIKSIAASRDPTRLLPSRILTPKMLTVMGPERRPSPPIYFEPHFEH